MENAITAGLSKQLVLARALETTANNIANQTTAGFKADRIAFREFLTRIDGAAAGDPMVSLVFDPDSFVDFSAGGQEPTYSPFDFAIDSEGFFGVETEAGLRYTRDGRFTLNAFGELVTRSGARVLDAGGSPILVDAEAGPLLLTPDGVLQQQNAPIATLGVFRFADTAALQKRGDNLFEATAEPVAAQAPRVRQGFIETSNVAPIAAVTDMIEIMRAYEQAAQILETSDALARKAVRTLSETA
ncbi:MAG: flagellar basal-body rod protein FlgF [Parvularculaceae bacterium]